MIAKKNKIGLGAFDLIKGIGMLDVMFWHMQTRFSVEDIPLLSPLFILSWFVQSGLMPMFFLISGYRFTPKKSGKMLKKTFLDLVVPFYYAFIVYVVFLAVLHYPIFGSIEVLTNFVVNRILGWLMVVPVEITFWGKDLVPTGALWFFWGLFIAQNILNQIVKIKITSVQIMITTVCVVIGYALLKLGFVFFCVPQGLMAVGFCYFGYAIKKQHLIDRWMSYKWVYLVLTGICLVQLVDVLVGGGGFDLARGNFNLLDYAAAGLSGVLFMLIGILISPFEWSGLDWVRWIGVHSYWVLGIHGVEMMGVPWYEVTIGITNRSLAFLIESILRVLIVIIACVIITRVSQYQYKKNRSKLVVKHGQFTI